MFFLRKMKNVPMQWPNFVRSYEIDLVYSAGNKLFQLDTQVAAAMLSLLHNISIKTDILQWKYQKNANVQRPPLPLSFRLISKSKQINVASKSKTRSTPNNSKKIFFYSEITDLSARTFGRKSFSPVCICEFEHADNVICFHQIRFNRIFKELFSNHENKIAHSFGHLVVHFIHHLCVKFALI